MRVLITGGAGFIGSNAVHRFLQRGAQVTIYDNLSDVLMNAMEHGGGFDPDQVAEVTAVRTARTMLFYLRDPGPGFDIAALPHATLTRPDDPLAVAELREHEGLRPGGFGLLLARKIIDELIHSERRNEVILIKHLL